MEGPDRIGTELVATVLRGPDRRPAFLIVFRSVHPFFMDLFLPTPCLSRKLRRTASKPSLRRASSNTSSMEIVLRPACLYHNEPT